MVKPLKNLDFFEAKHYYLMKSKLYAVFCAVFIFTICQTVYAQEDKGVTASGKEVDCSTIDPLVDKTVSEHGKVVLSPRVTRNGKLITAECAPIIPVIPLWSPIRKWEPFLLETRWRFAVSRRGKLPRCS